MKGYEKTDDGVGLDYQAEMFMCVENAVSFNRSIILVTTRKENPHSWFVRIQDDRRDFGRTYDEFSSDYFRKLAFKASLEAKESGKVSSSSIFIILFLSPCSSPPCFTNVDV